MIQGASSDVAASSLYNVSKFIQDKNFKTKPFSFVHDSLEFDIHPKELFYLIESIQYQMNNYPEERFGVPAKSDITLGYSMGEECKVKEYKPDEDYKGGEITLSGHGDCIDRLLLSWARFFDKVEVEVLEEKPLFHPWREVFQVKRSYFTNMGHHNTDMKVRVILRYSEGKGCKVTGRDIQEKGLIPMKHYIDGEPDA